MRKAIRHSGALLATAIIGLSLIGAAYALWFEDLTLTANVTTGTFNVDWSCESPTNVEIECEDAVKTVVSLDQGTTWVEFGTPGAPVSKAHTCTLEMDDDVEGANDLGDNNVLNLNMGTGLYPYAGCEFRINIHNAGSVPAHITRWQLDLQWVDGPWAIAFQVVPGSEVWAGTAAGCPGPGCPSGSLTAADACELIRPALENLGPGPEFGPSEAPGLQLHTSNRLICTFRLYISQIDQAEGQTFSATWKLKAHQWNEEVQNNINEN